MSIQKDLQNLLDAQVITQETADKITTYYATQKQAAPNRLLVVFGVIGAILIGSGIMLILAHNWDTFSRFTKTFFSLLPLLIGQLICAYTFFKKYDSITWREASSAFLIFAVGGSIAMVGQIYNIPGDPNAFLLTWLLLCLPLVYIMRSSVTSLLFLAGATYYTTQVGYWKFNATALFTYAALLLAIMPHYYYLWKEKSTSNALGFHHWGIALSLAICTGIVADSAKQTLLLTYMSLAGLFFLIGNSAFFRHQSYRSNAYKILGVFGSLALLFLMSFDDFWREIFRKKETLSYLLSGPEMLTALLFMIPSGILLWQQANDKTIGINKPFQVLFLVFLLVFLLEFALPGIAFLFVNILLFAIGIWIIRHGAIQNRLGVLNLGLMVMTLLIICRFFDFDIPFVLRGILFVLIGIAFFIVNYRMVQKGKENN